MAQLFLIITGIACGFLISQETKKRQNPIQFLRNLVFLYVLPYLVFAEVSSMPLGEWPFFIYGSIFVLGLFYLGIFLKVGVHRAALLATAEGGTLGFLIYSYLAKGHLSQFFLIDMLGNGAVLFSFIYWQVTHGYQIKELFKNHLMLAMGMGLVANLLGWHMLDYTAAQKIEPFVTILTTALISIVVGSEIILRVSKDIFMSGFFWLFWLIRASGALLSIFFRLPLALTILFILPPSFLLPVIYSSEQFAEKRYASNLIAACLPVTFVAAVILTIILKFQN